MTEREVATLKVEELPDGRIVLTWDENDPACAFLNGKTEAEIVAMIEQGLESMMSEEKTGSLKSVRRNGKK